MRFEQKVPFGTLTNSHTPSHFRLRARSDTKMEILLTNDFWAQKRNLGPKTHLGAKVFFPHKNAFFLPMSRMLITTMVLKKNGALFGPKSVLGEKCVSGNNINSWAQKAGNCAKMRSGTKSASFAKVTKKLRSASTFQRENRDFRFRAQTASTGGRGSQNL